MVEIVLSVAEAEALVVEALMSSGASEPNARSVAKALIAAELAGQGGHGLRRVAAYAAQVRVGKVDGRAVPSAERVRPGAIRIDARHGFAFPAIDLAIDELCAAAPEQGLVMAGIVHSHHSGVAGLAVERLAERGLVAMMFTNSPAAIAPWGAKRALFGTNPIAFAAPMTGGEPVIVDVSLSKVARGKLMAAAQKGEAIPEGWALDGDGRATTDAKAGLAGTMAPLGDAKGTALALMVELLAAGLTGANFATAQSSFFDDKGAPPGTGQFFLAIDPDAFGDGALDRFAALAAMIEGDPGARLPGRRRQAMARRMLVDGIAIDAAVVDEIRKIGR